MSIATTLASLAHAILVLVRPGVWEAIFGTAAVTHRSCHMVSRVFNLPCVRFFLSFLGGVESAVAIIVCSMSVIIPAILRTLGVGDPFMREDTVDPRFSTGIEIAHTTSTRIELGLLTSRGTEIVDGSKSEEAIGTVTSRQRDSIDLDAKDQKHRLTTQTLDGSLGDLKSTSRVEPPVDESDVTDSLTQLRSLPGVVKRDQDIEAVVGKRHTKNNST